MRIARAALLVLFVVLVSGTVQGVTMTVGNEFVGGMGTDSGTAIVRTNIDVEHPATHTGHLQTANVYWHKTGCTNAFKIKFFRRVDQTLTMVAERGPFTATSKAFTVALNPSVLVEQGDLIGVARVGDCGASGVMGLSEGFTRYLQYPGDVTGSVTMVGAHYEAGSLAVNASGNATEWRARVVPVVGSSPGAFGAHFKTEMQFLNPQATGTLVFRLVLRRAGVAGSPSDPKYNVTLGPGETKSVGDIVAAMGHVGLGSLDLVVPADQNLPVIITRVFNDAGADGASSLTEDMVETAPATVLGTKLLTSDVAGFLVTPRDLAKTRFNIGVRTLESGAALFVTVRNSAGVVRRQKAWTYTANFFEQRDAASFAGGPIFGDESLQIKVVWGSAIIYGSTTCNVTNDPSIQFVTGILHTP